MVWKACNCVNTLIVVSMNAFGSLYMWWASFTGNSKCMYVMFYVDPACDVHCHMLNVSDVIMLASRVLRLVHSVTHLEK